MHLASLNWFFVKLWVVSFNPYDTYVVGGVREACGLARLRVHLATGSPPCTSRGQADIISVVIGYNGGSIIRSFTGVCSDIMGSVHFGYRPGVCRFLREPAPPHLATHFL